MCPHEDNPPAWLVRYHKRLHKHSGRDFLYYCPYVQKYSGPGGSSGNELRFLVGANDPGEALAKAKRTVAKNLKFIERNLSPSEKVTIVWGKPYKVTKQNMRL